MTEINQDANLASKTQRKKEMHALVDLGIEISALPKSLLQQLLLPDNLILAIEDYLKIKSFGAKKRQRQYIGKLMRRLSEDEIENLRLKINAYQQSSAAKDAEFHLSEKWRDALLSEKTTQALTEFLNDYPNCDRQALRHHIKKAQDEIEKGKNLGHKKALFRLIRQTISQHSPE